MHKPVMWDGKPLSGIWEVTIKIDGIRVLKNEKDEIVSRNGKPLHNMDHLKHKMGPDGCEVCVLGDFSATVTAVRTHNSYPVDKEFLYSLNPIDSRLWVDVLANPSPKEIWKLYKNAVKKGFEGLVLRQGDRWLKVKKEETIDVTVVGVYEGKGKHVGRLGGFITTHGRVGTGIKDEERVLWWVHRLHSKEIRPNPLIGTTIECKCMELTPAGKMRKPRFIRLRPDK